MIHFYVHWYFHRSQLSHPVLFFTANFHNNFSQGSKQLYIKARDCYSHFGMRGKVLATTPACTPRLLSSLLLLRTGHTPKSARFHAYDVHSLFIANTGVTLCEASDNTGHGNTQSEEQLLCFWVGVEENRRRKYDW